jgi:hypothetical protein
MDNIRVSSIAPAFKIWSRTDVIRLVYRSSYHMNMQTKVCMAQITTTGNLGPMILQSLAPAMLYVPTPTMNYITVCDKVSMPPNGGTTMRFMRPRALTPPTVQLGNSGIDPAAQIPQRDKIMNVAGKFSLIDSEALKGDEAQALLAA